MKRSHLLAIAMTLVSLSSIAQDYPVNPVRLIIAIIPGTSTDIVGRIVFQKVAEIWGQPVVPENRAGAGGSIGTAAVANAQADGYTLLVDSSAHSVTPAIYAKLPYDTQKDFIDIAPLTVQPNIMVVSASSPYKTLLELVNAAKAKPGVLNIGHAGIGSGTHLYTERLVAATGINIAQIPFKGTPEVIAAILGGSVDGYWAPISAAMPNIKSGKLRPLAASTAKRNPQLPEVPTTAEAGVQNADAPLWFGVWARAGNPPGIISKINTDVRRALADPAVKSKLEALGNDTMDMSSQEFTAFVREQTATYAQLIKAAGIKPQ